MVGRVVTHTRALFNVGPWAMRILMLLAVVSWGGPPLLRLMNVDLSAKPAVLLAYHSTRGPWLGIKLTDGSFTHNDGPTDYIFHAGDWVVWESDVDVMPGATVSGEYTLWCGGKPIASADSHLYSNETRPRWRRGALQIPKGAPTGDCGIRRHGEAIGPNGEHQVKDDYPVINIKVELS